MCKYYDIDGEYVSAHDCHVTKVLFENGVLSFVFDDGIWVSNRHPGNATDKTIHTDVAELKFYLESGDECDITMYVFEEKSKMTVREEWEPSKLIESINSGKCTLEFLYDYKGYHSMIVECWLWSDKKPYHRECEIKLSITQVKYCWNDFCEDREW